MSEFQKIVLRGAEPSRQPIPVPFPDIAGPDLTARHNDAWGFLPELGFYRISDCAITEGGYVRDRKSWTIYDADDLDHPWWRSKRTLGLAPAKASRAVRAGNRTLVKLMNPGHRVYGHWILDLLPSAWLLHQNPEAFKDGRPQWIIANDTPAWARDMMRFLFDSGDDDFVIFDPSVEDLFVDRVIVPSNLRVSPIMSTLFDGFVDDVLARVRSTDERRKIIISRANGRHVGRRFMRNWQEILDTALAAGCEILAPEYLSWPEQLKIFRGAKLVISEYGSALHSTLFAPEDCLVIALSAPSANQNQSAISALRQQTLQFIPAFDYKRDDKGEQHFSVSVELFSKCLEKFGISGNGDAVY